MTGKVLVVSLDPRAVALPLRGAGFETLHVRSHDEFVAAYHNGTMRDVVVAAVVSPLPKSIDLWTKSPVARSIQLTHDDAESVCMACSHLGIPAILRRAGVVSTEDTDEKLVASVEAAILRRQAAFEREGVLELAAA